MFINFTIFTAAYFMSIIIHNVVGAVVGAVTTEAVEL